MLKKKDGFATIIAMILILIALPLLFFTVVDLPYYATAHRRVQNIADNIAGGAATLFYETSSADGIIEFDEWAIDSFIATELQQWFELEAIPLLPTGGYTQLILKPDSSSYFQKDPIILKLAPNNFVDLNNVPVSTPIIEYIVYNPKDNLSEQSFLLSTGEVIKLYKPTIFISIRTKVYAPAALIPLNLHKTALVEVTMGTNQ